MQWMTIPLTIRPGRWAFIVSRDVHVQIAGVEPFRDLCRRNAGPGDHWPSERNPYDVEDVDLEHPGQHRPGVEDVRLETEEARSSQRATTSLGLPGQKVGDIEGQTLHATPRW